MTKVEIKRLGELVIRQKALCNEIHAMDQRAKHLTETEQRILDQHYGECIGIEKALALLRIPFKSVDD